MNKLKIKNFGPIKSGYPDSDDGFFDISKVSIFVGDQGTGKSSVAKIISLFSWLEKQHQSQNTDEIVISHSDFKNEFLSFHRIDSFLQDDTEIRYFSDNCSISYYKNELHIKKINDKYIRPKVLYVPAERSFCTAIFNPNKVTGMPKNVLDFLSDYYDSIKAQNGKTIQLPLNGYEFRFSENDNRAYISEKDNYEIKIEEASSGLQSLTPLFITINYYLSQIQLPIDKRFEEFSLEQINQLKEVLSKHSLKKNISKEKINSIISQTKDSFKIISDNNEQNHFINSRLICIIEEPEQSLFPTSQYEIFMHLLKGFSNETNNSLVLTTHSPYILETINNSIYADTIRKSGKDSNHLIPEEYQVSYDNVSVYQIENGEIHSIMDADIKQINPAAIDKCSQKITDIFTKLTNIDFGE